MCMYKIALNDELLQRTRQTFADQSVKNRRTSRFSKKYRRHY